MGCKLGRLMNTTERATLYRQRSTDFEQKASTARTEEMRRAWLILARDWKKMAEREELKFFSAPALIPEPENDLEQAIKQLAGKYR